MKETKILLKSHNFISGVSGWAFYDDGSFKMFRNTGLAVELKNLPLPAPQSVGSLTYDLKIDTSAASATLEAFKEAVDASGFSGPFVITGNLLEQATIINAKIADRPKFDRAKFMSELTIAAVQSGMSPTHAADDVQRAVKTLFPDQE